MRLAKRFFSCAEVLFSEVPKTQHYLRGSLNLLIYSRLSFTSFKVLFKDHAYLVSAISLSPLKIFMLNGGLSLRTVVSIGLSGYIKE